MITSRNSFGSVQFDFVDLVQMALNVGPKKTIKKVKHDLVLFAAKDFERRVDTLIGGFGALENGFSINGRRPRQPKPKKATTPEPVKQRPAFLPENVDVIEAEVVK